MRRGNSIALGMASVATIMLTGCMPKMTIEDMKASMPQRPAELDKLNMFAGRWESEGQARMSGLDEELKITGTTESSWDGGGWYMVGRSKFKMGDFDEMQGMETWMYDVKAKKYRSTWVDSMGTLGTGTAEYCEKSNTWYMKATSHGPFGKSKIKGTVKFIDENTMEWTWSEHAMGGMMKVMEMCGTSRKK